MPSKPLIEIGSFRTSRFSAAPTDPRALVFYEALAGWEPDTHTTKVHLYFQHDVPAIIEERDYGDGAVRFAWMFVFPKDCVTTTLAAAEELLVDFFNECNGWTAENMEEAS